MDRSEPELELEKELNRIIRSLTIDQQETDMGCRPTGMKIWVRALLLIYVWGMIPHAGYVWTRDCNVREKDKRDGVNSFVCMVATTAIWPPYEAIKGAALVLSEENLAWVSRLSLKVEP